MPKKTKRQKILAQQRRHIPATLYPTPKTVHQQEATIPPTTFHFQQSHSSVKLQENHADKEELTVIQKDITKTLILAALAIIIELGVHSMLHGT